MSVYEEGKRTSEEEHHLRVRKKRATYPVSLGFGGRGVGGWVGGGWVLILVRRRDYSQCAWFWWTWGWWVWGEYLSRTLCA